MYNISVNSYAEDWHLNVPVCRLGTSFSVKSYVSTFDWKHLDSYTLFIYSVFCTTYIYIQNLGNWFIPNSNINSETVNVHDPHGIGVRNLTCIINYQERGRNNHPELPV